MLTAYQNSMHPLQQCSAQIWPKKAIIFLIPLKYLEFRWFYICNCMKYMCTYLRHLCVEKKTNSHFICVEMEVGE